MTTVQLKHNVIIVSIRRFAAIQEVLLLTVGQQIMQKLAAVRCTSWPAKSSNFDQMLKLAI